MEPGFFQRGTFKWDLQNLNCGTFVEPRTFVCEVWNLVEAEQVCGPLRNLEPLGTKALSETATQNAVYNSKWGLHAYVSPCGTFI